MSLVEVSGLSYTYPGAERPALSGIDLRVEAGEVVVVAGLSGSGKSTLLRALSGLVPHFHGGSFGGSVRVAGLDTREHRPGELAAHVGTLAQDPETQAVMGSPRSELAFPLENRGWAPAARARAVEEVAIALGLGPLLDSPTSTLSGGELQRVALGATLVGRPALICLDEPTSQLDPVSGDELIGLLSRLNDDTDVAVVLAAHRLERCLGAADRVVALAGGSIAFDGEPEAFLGWALREAPLLVTPGARLLDGYGLIPAVGVRAARAALRRAGFVPTAPVSGAPRPEDAVLAGRAPWAPRRPSRHRATEPEPALRFNHVWHELRDGPVLLRDLSLKLEPGERVALMGRNGAGKSTLLRHAAGLMTPTRGRVQAGGRVALLMQNPGDYLVHDTVAAELGAHAEMLERFGLRELARRHPRDLSGGERQRLALAVVLDGGTQNADARAAVLALDEPTRGMDRGVRDDLVRLLLGFDGAVIVATHDPEFAAAFAQRVVLLADGGVIADGATDEVLSGGIYFATETARILNGLTPGVPAADGGRPVGVATPVVAPARTGERT